MKMKQTILEAKARRASLLAQFDAIEPKWGAIQALANQNNVTNARIWQLLRQAKIEAIKE